MFIELCLFFSLNPCLCLNSPWDYFWSWGVLFQTCRPWLQNISGSSLPVLFPMGSRAVEAFSPLDLAELGEGRGTGLQGRTQPKA